MHELRKSVKSALYFLVAGYFLFFARRVLRRWAPRVIVITGSSGKTTLFNLLETQLGSDARFTHHANSIFGIPFDLLGLKRTTLLKREWLGLFVRAPLGLFRPLPEEKLYVVELDCDRPREGEIMAELLKPEVTIWLSLSSTHSMNFDALVAAGEFATPIAAVAHEFGHLAAATTKLLVYAADNSHIRSQLSRVRGAVTKVPISLESIESFTVSAHSTLFELGDRTATLPLPQPIEVGTSVLAVIAVCEYLEIVPDYSFSGFKTPPGRFSVFAGKGDTLLVDSSYNANPESMRVVLHAFSAVADTEGRPNRVLIIGDMLEQGESEAVIHTAIASELSAMRFSQLVLYGRAVEEYTKPALLEAGVAPDKIYCFMSPKDIYEHLLDTLHGGEIILFKGYRLLDGVVERLLADPTDATKLCRRELVWQRKREIVFS